MTGRIQAEHNQRKPTSSLEEDTFIALQRTADALLRPFEDLMRGNGLSATQYNVLRILRGAGQAGLACSEIGERMITRDPDITRLLDRMERRRLVERSRDRNDRRVILGRITSRGLEVLRSLDRPVQDFHKQLLRHMPSSSLRDLEKLLGEARAPKAASTASGPGWRRSI
jgi:MarR family transcriptional regulator, organic hydroperoxide resistance regulator